MSSLSVTNNFVAGTTILSAAMNMNFDDVEIYINNRNSGAAAWERVLATNSSDVPGVFNNSAGTNDILNCQDNGTNIFRVADAGNVIIGSAAISTSATDGFLYIPSCAGTPTGAPTAFTGRAPVVLDSANNILYYYNSSAWRNAANNPGVDNSTIELNSNLLRVKDGLTIQTLNIGTALQYKTFASLQILQIVKGISRTNTTTTNTTYTDSDISIAITPKLNTSKIFILAAGTCRQNVGDNGYLTIARSGTNISSDDNGFFGTTSNNNYCFSMIAYDSPATTSAVTYRVRLRTAGGGGSIETNPSIGGTIAESSIIAIEVAQ